MRKTHLYTIYYSKASEKWLNKWIHIYIFYSLYTENDDFFHQNSSEKPFFSLLPEKDDLFSVE